MVVYIIYIRIFSILLYTIWHECDPSEHGYTSRKLVFGTRFHLSPFHLLHAPLHSIHLPLISLSLSLVLWMRHVLCAPQDMCNMNINF